jgi:hypothetical protein
VGALPLDPTAVGALPLRPFTVWLCAGSELPERVCSFDNIADYWRTMNRLPTPTGLRRRAHTPSERGRGIWDPTLEHLIHIFAQDPNDPSREIAPTWEDPSNKGGTRWFFSIAPDRQGRDILAAGPAGEPIEHSDSDEEDGGCEYLTVADQVWHNLCLELVRGALDPQRIVAGIIYSLREKYGRYSVWLVAQAPADAILALGMRLQESLKLEVDLECQAHGAGYDVPYIHRLPAKGGAKPPAGRRG